MKWINAINSGLVVVINNWEYTPLLDTEEYHYRWVGDFKCPFLEEEGITRIDRQLGKEIQVEDYCLPEDAPGELIKPEGIESEASMYIALVNAGYMGYVPKVNVVDVHKTCTCPTLLSGHHRGCPYVEEQ